MTGPVDAGATEVSFESVLSNLAASYSSQLAEANIDAARWKAAAQATVTELAAVRTELAGLEERVKVAEGSGAARSAKPS